MQSHTIAINQFALVQYAASVGGVWRSPGGAYSRSLSRVNASKAPLSRIFLRVFSRLFSPGLRLDLPQICARGGEPTRAGLKRNRTRIYSPTHRPSKTPPAAPSAFHRRFVGYHRPPRRLRPTPVHSARKRLAHIALRLYDERFVMLAAGYAEPLYVERRRTAAYDVYVRNVRLVGRSITNFFLTVVFSR